MVEIQKMISPFNRYVGGNNVQYIVLHDVGALGQAKANVNYFNAANRGASAHLFVDETSIWQSVEFKDGAWHVGDDKKGDSHDVGDLIHNRNSIGIEMCLDKNWKVTKKTKANTVELVNYLLKLYPKAIIVRHYDASGKTCPRSMSANNWSEWNQFKAQINGYKAPSNIIKVNMPNSVTVAKNDTLWGISEQYNTDVKTLKAINGLSSDTIHVGTVLKLASTGVKKPVIAVKSVSIVKAKLKVDGYMGSGTIKALQAYFKTPQDGVMSKPSMVVKALQKLVGSNADGYFGKNTIKAMQKRFGTPQDGIISEPSMVVKELQRRLNAGKL